MFTKRSCLGVECIIYEKLLQLQIKDKFIRLGQR